ncbi:Uncharacterised protein [Serratia fonticola]|uniref:Uncharacterized protein n=1 Tax=Serratia fonticola TaxID=47917 RepID=A0A4U9W225_SERFO|nr:Uncharacterised protein [Serratia fonticola]
MKIFLWIIAIIFIVGLLTITGVVQTDLLVLTTIGRFNAPCITLQ